MLFKIMLFSLVSVPIFAAEHLNNALNNQPLPTTPAESHVIRIRFREKTDALRDRNLIAPELHSAVTEAIRSRPLKEIDQLLDFIYQTHEKRIGENN